MPAETRLITFTEAEVVEALLAFCEATSRPMPADGATCLIVRNGADTKFALASPKDGPKTSFYESEVAAALLAYCKKKHIPIARRSAKSLEVMQDAVALRLTLG